MKNVEDRNIVTCKNGDRMKVLVQSERKIHMKLARHLNMSKDIAQ
jgi:hypothetical protein